MFLSLAQADVGLRTGPLNSIVPMIRGTIGEWASDAIASEAAGCYDHGIQRSGTDKCHVMNYGHEASESLAAIGPIKVQDYSQLHRVYLRSTQVDQLPPASLVLVSSIMLPSNTSDALDRFSEFGLLGR